MLFKKVSIPIFFFTLFIFSALITAIYGAYYSFFDFILKTFVCMSPFAFVVGFIVFYVEDYRSKRNKYECRFDRITNVDCLEFITALLGLFFTWVEYKTNRLITCWKKKQQRKL